MAMTQLIDGTYVRGPTLIRAVGYYMSSKWLSFCISIRQSVIADWLHALIAD